MRFCVTVLFCFVLSQHAANAQLLDDSTKQIYNSKTVKFVYENDLFKNKKSEFNPDTLLGDFKQMVFPNALRQDLGNIGTATFDIVSQPNKTLFLTPRYSVFEVFKVKPEAIRYFNTRSPYTNLDYIQGSKGYSRLNFIHSQNINPRLNVTIDVDKYNASKQYGTNTAEEKLVDHWNYTLSSNYSSKNNKFKLLASLIHFNHSQNEQGGILEKENLSIKPTELLANYRTNYQVQLTPGSYNREKQNLLHLYSQFIVRKGIQMFAKVDLDAQKYILTDTKFEKHKLETYSNFNFLPKLNTIILGEDTLLLNSKFLSFANTVGFKGRYKSINYDAYGKYRIFSYKNKVVLGLDSLNKGNYKAKPEFLLGGSMDYYFRDSLNFIKANAEASLDLGIFYTEGLIHFKGLEGSFNQSITAPSLQYQNYYNGAMFWKSDFKNVSQTIIKAAFPLKFRNINFKPFFQNTLFINYLYFDFNSFYNNYLYFEQKISPKQLSKALNNTHLGFDLSFPVRKFNFKSITHFNLSSDKVVYPVPFINNFTTIAYRFKYAKVLNLEIGADITYRSKYKALNYSVLLNQFYNASDFQTWGNVVVDPYLQFKVNAVKLALRFQHINQGLPNQGFYATPYYLYNPRTFYLRVEWPLFD